MYGVVVCATLKNSPFGDHVAAYPIPVGNSEGLLSLPGVPHGNNAVARGITSPLKSPDQVIPTSITLSAGTLPNISVSVIFLVTGVPLGSSTTTNKSAATGSVSDVSSVIFLFTIFSFSPFIL